jgi:hypothetical protein
VTDYNILKVPANPSCAMAAILENGYRYSVLSLLRLNYAQHRNWIDTNVVGEGPIDVLSLYIIPQKVINKGARSRFTLCHSRHLGKLLLFFAYFSLLRLSCMLHRNFIYTKVVEEGAIDVLPLNIMPHKVINKGARSRSKLRHRC